jgi:hypothetical protein
MSKQQSTAFTFANEALRFFRSQPVFPGIVVLLGAVPLSLLEWAEKSLEPSPWAYAVQLLAVIAAMWSLGATLLIGRRMLERKAGRARTSLKAVAREALALVPMLAVTSLLQACLIAYAVLAWVTAVLLLLVTDTCSARELPMALWQCKPFFFTLPLLIPALVLGVRTVLWSVAAVIEGKPYRAAIRQSLHVTKRRFWHVAVTLVLLCAVFFGPAVVAAWAVDRMLTPLPATTALPLSIFLANVLVQVAITLVSLSLIPFFADLKKRRAADEAKRLLA